ncbi:MAG: PIN domain-containing protein [Hymenobacter sp.]|nr:PIN domain-containing protein [Hymenobacter sp.]
MSAKFFLDTTILVYAYSANEPAKNARARALNLPANGWVSTQVLTELVNVLPRKFKLDWSVADIIPEDITASFSIRTNTPATILRATHVAQPYGFSWFDSLIVAALDGTLRHALPRGFTAQPAAGRHVARHQSLRLA